MAIGINSYTQNSVQPFVLAKPAETKPTKTKPNPESKMDTKSKVTIGAGLAALAAVGVYIATKGKNKAATEKLAKEAEAKAAKEAEAKLAKEAEAKAAKEAEAKLAKEAQAKAAKEAEAKAAKEAEAKLAKEAQAKAAKEAEEKAAQEAEAKLAKEAERHALNEFNEFKNTISSKSEKELKEICDSVQQEAGNFNDKLRQRRDDAGIMYYDKPLPYFLKPNEKSKYALLEQKDNLIRSELTKKENNFLEKVLHNNSDKEVNVLWNKEYMSKDELDAFGHYYDESTENTSMRFAKGSYKSKITELMDSGFAKAPALKDDAVVYRAVTPFTPKQETDVYFKSLEKGRTITDYSYMSTSTDVVDVQFKEFVGTARTSEGGVLMRIHLPKGTRGVLGGQNEYLLPRNSQLKITDTKMVDGVKLVECEYILPKVK